MREIYDFELAALRETLRKNHNELDQLMADGRGYDLMKAMTRIETAAKLFQQRLAEIK